MSVAAGRASRRGHGRGGSVERLRKVRRPQQFLPNRNWAPVTQPARSLPVPGRCFEQGVLVMTRRPDDGAELSGVWELNINLNANLEEIRLFEGSDVVVAPLPDNKGGLETIRVTGLGQQLLGFRGIVGTGEREIDRRQRSPRRDLVWRFEQP